MKKLITIFLMLLTINFVSGQELDVDVSVNTPKLQTVDPGIFKTLKSSMQDFMNNEKWSEDEFEQYEKIEVSIQLTITKEASPTSFYAKMSIQAVRPVYGSSYKTPVFTHLDKDIFFTYEQYQPLENNKNTFTDNLSSVLTYYAYMVLGFDYDTFSPFGGEPYFQLANSVVNNIPESQTSVYKGWRASDGNRNRYWLVENVLSPRVRPFRQVMYDYHRQGLDVMAENAGGGRNVIKAAIAEVLKVNDAYPNSMVIQMFNDTKRSELIEIFKMAPMQDKNLIIRQLTKMDPSNASKYRQIRK